MKSADNDVAAQSSETLDYVYGKPGNDAVVELTVCLDLIRQFVPGDINHPACKKYRRRAALLIKVIANHKE